MKFAEDKAREIGDALSVDWSKIDISEFAKGLEVELEHKDVTGGDLMLTGKIALAHLKEVPDYYTKLKAHVELNKAVAMYELKKAVRAEIPHKEPYEMNVQEFHDSRQEGPFQLDWMETHFLHRDCVKDAIAQGKLAQIHPDNRKEYPELFKASNDLVKGKLEIPKGYRLAQITLHEGGVPYKQHRLITENEPVPEGWTVIEHPEDIEWPSTKTKWFGTPNPEPEGESSVGKKKRKYPHQGNLR